MGMYSFMCSTKKMKWFCHSLQKDLLYFTLYVHIKTVILIYSKIINQVIYLHLRLTNSDRCGLEKWWRNKL